MPKSKSMCSGCRNNRYNMGKGYAERPGIDAPVTADECWSYKSAKIVKRKMVPMSQRPPWNQKPIKVLSCYSKTGYAFIDPKNVR